MEVRLELKVIWERARFASKAPPAMSVTLSGIVKLVVEGPTG